ncbi:MAG: hypothetical protein KAH01_00140, partial [Caldisericia bacterium]|nr:hypothetical protein [Caldisericia bacterium]
PCFLPDVGTGGQVEDIPLSENNDSCSEYHRNPSTGALYLVVYGPREKNDAGEMESHAFYVQVGVQKESEGWIDYWGAAEIKKGLEGQKASANPDEKQMIQGIIDAVTAIDSTILRGTGNTGLLLNRALNDAFSESNLFQNQTTTYNRKDAYCWEAFEGEYTGDEKYRAWMKHSIIGGFIASKMSNAVSGDAYGIPDDELNRMIGFSVSFMFEGSGFSLPLYNGFGQFDNIDLVGIAHLLKGMIKEERRSRDDDRGKWYVPLFESHNPMNIHVSYKNGNDSHDVFSRFNNGEGLSWKTVTRSRFLNIIAGVGVLIIKARDYVSEYNPPLKYSNRSAFFWFEAARRYNGGLQDETNDANYERICNYMSNFKSLDGRYGEQVYYYYDYLLKISGIY